MVADVVAQWSHGCGEAFESMLPEYFVCLSARECRMEQAEPDVIHGACLEACKNDYGAAGNVSTTCKRSFVTNFELTNTRVCGDNIPLEFTWGFGTIPQLYVVCFVSVLLHSCEFAFSNVQGKVPYAPAVGALLKAVYNLFVVLHVNVSMYRATWGLKRGCKFLLGISLPNYIPWCTAMSQTILQLFACHFAHYFSEAESGKEEGRREAPEGEQEGKQDKKAKKQEEAEKISDIDKYKMRILVLILCVTVLISVPFLVCLFAMSFFAVLLCLFFPHVAFCIMALTLIYLGVASFCIWVGTMLFFELPIWPTSAKNDPERLSEKREALVTYIPLCVCICAFWVLVPCSLGVEASLWERPGTWESRSNKLWNTILVRTSASWDDLPDPLGDLEHMSEAFGALWGRSLQWIPMPCRQMPRAHRCAPRSSASRLPSPKPWLRGSGTSAVVCALLEDSWCSGIQ